ncbi:MAG: response regulator [Desulfobulbaceae bacterium]|nr:MAG: response regulator [Desulfobulbaceae bacterium]
MTEFSILIVEDEPAILRGTSRLLKNAGYTVLEANSGADALECAATELPDLILLDIVLPDIDGIEICRKLRASARTSSIYIAMISGLRRSSQEVIEGFESGADDYIRRPIDNDELLARIQSMVHTIGLEQELISHRDRLEELLEAKIAELKGSEYLRYAFMESATDGFFLLDQDLNIIELNHTATDFLRAAKQGDNTETLSVVRFLTDHKLASDVLHVVETGIPFFKYKITVMLNEEERHFSLKAFKVRDGIGMIVSDVNNLVRSEYVTLIKKDVRYPSLMLPICQHCKKVRDMSGEWHMVEKYIYELHQVDLSHTICPDCAHEIYPDMDLYDT